MSIIERLLRPKTGGTMKYKITYEVIREVEADELFPKDVLGKNLLESKISGTIPNWMVRGEKLISIKVKSAKVIK